MQASCLTDHLVPGTNDVYYISEFVTEEEEALLIRKVLLMKSRLALERTCSEWR